MGLSRGYEMATDEQFKDIGNFATPVRAGRVTAIEMSGQVRVECDDPEGGDVLAWPLNGFIYEVGNVVYVDFALNNPESAIVVGCKSVVPRVDHGFSGARVFSSAAQSIPDSSYTALTFNSEQFDTDGYHSTTVNTSRLTAPTDGIYALSAGMSFDVDASGVRIMVIRLNGTTDLVTTVLLANGGGYTTPMDTGTIAQLAAGHYVEMMVYQDSGGALDAQANNSVLAIARLGSI